MVGTWPRGAWYSTIPLFSVLDGDPPPAEEAPEPRVVVDGFDGAGAVPTRLRAVLREVGSSAFTTAFKN